MTALRNIFGSEGYYTLVIFLDGVISGGCFVQEVQPYSAGLALQSSNFHVRSFQMGHAAAINSKFSIRLPESTVKLLEDACILAFILTM